MQRLEKWLQIRGPWHGRPLNRGGEPVCLQVSGRRSAGPSTAGAERPVGHSPGQTGSIFGSEVDSGLYPLCTGKPLKGLKEVIMSVF